MRIMGVKASNQYNQIIAGCLQNDRVCQQQLYDTFASKMLAVCMRYATTQQEAEDVMIEGFVSVFAHLGDFNQNGNLEAWVRQIMVNKAISNYRNNKRRYNHAVIDENIEIQDDLNIDIDAKISGKKIIEMIQQMPDNLKMVFNLRIFEDYEFKDIAGEMGIPTSTARVYFHRAKEWITEHIKLENYL